MTAPPNGTACDVGSSDSSDDVNHVDGSASASRACAPVMRHLGCEHAEGGQTRHAALGVIGHLHVLHPAAQLQGARRVGAADDDRPPVVVGRQAVVRVGDRREVGKSCPSAACAEAVRPPELDE